MDWTTKQVEQVLEAVYQRLSADPAAFQTEQKGKELNIRKWDMTLPGGGKNDISINICDSYVWMSLQGHSGLLSISDFFFVQRKLKKLIKDIKILVKFGSTTADGLITSLFPEVVTEEFEKTVLGKKDK